MMSGSLTSFSSGLERDVGHALEGDRRPAVGVAAAVRRLLADQVRLIARRLVVDERAVLDRGASASS